MFMYHYKEGKKDIKHYLGFCNITSYREVRDCRKVVLVWAPGDCDPWAWGWDGTPEGLEAIRQYFRDKGFPVIRINVLQWEEDIK